MQSWKRLAPPAVAVAAVVAYAVVPAATASGAVHPTLPALTAAQLLTKVAGAKVQGLSGTVRESADLGLPSLPASSSVGARGGAGGLTGLLSGTHTLTVAAAPGKLRVAVLGELSEQDLVVDGTTVKTYDSTTGRGTSTALPALPALPAHADKKAWRGRTALMAPSAASLTPQGAAQQALMALDPSTAVSIDPTAEVAGRPAYTLVLTPRSTETLVSRVEIALDAATGVPLRTAIYATGHAAPAFSTAFTTISFATPKASTFTLDVPGATTTGKAPAANPGALSSDAYRHTSHTSRTGQHAADRVSTIGTGWAAVTKVDGIKLTTAQTKQLDELSTAVPAGRLISTRLVSVLLTPDGTAYLGAVPPSVLEKDAG